MGLAFEGAGFDLRVIGDANGIDNHEAVLGYGVGGDGGVVLDGFGGFAELGEGGGRGCGG